MRGEVEDGMRFLEGRLEAVQGEGPYWLGPDMSLVDAAYFPFFERIPVFEHYRGLRIPEECVRLQRWLAAVAERPAVAETCHDLAYFIPRYAHYAGGTAQGLSAQAFRSGAAN